MKPRKWKQKKINQITVVDFQRLIFNKSTRSELN